MSCPIVTQKAYTSVTVKLVYNYNVNTVYFDGIQLFRENYGSSYTYDENGNIISVVDLQRKTTTYEYIDNKLTKEILPTGVVVRYSYDPYRNLIYMNTTTGLRYSFVYDQYGNNTVVSADGEIISRAAYSDDGNRLVSTTDAAGKVTEYGYDENTNALLWVQYPEDTETTRTNYTYDDIFRLVRASATTNTGYSLIAQYTYTDDLLTSIETGSTEYGFTYADFSKRSTIKVGNRTLASYLYTEEEVSDRNYDLDRLDYGNNDSVEYAYDKKGRVIKQTYEDGTALLFYYDSSGNLARTGTRGRFCCPLRKIKNRSN